MKNIIRFLLLFGAVALLLPSCKKDDDPVEWTCEEEINTIRVNHFQMLGSHNSYRLRTHEPILQYIYDNLDVLPPGFNPDAWDYTHLSLTEQFDDYGIRSIELDVYNDPDGGLFYNRMGNALVGESPDSGEPKLAEPGLKVLHFPDFDYNTHYLTFKDALMEVKNWSDAHPNHMPITIMVEPKEDSPNALLGDPFTTTIPFDKASLGTIDDEIKAVFGANLNNVITPDMVRGSYATLNEAVLDNKWPRLVAARGKVMFVLLPSGDELTAYLDGHPSLENRVMFAFSTAGEPEAAFLKFDDPIANENDITTYVNEGYMVRTRADAGTVEARSGSTARLEAALNSNAQIISTDYYKADGRPGWSDYVAALPDGKMARICPDYEVSPDLTCNIGE